MGGLLLAVGAALGSVWVFSLSLEFSFYCTCSIPYPANRQASAGEHRRMKVLCRALRDKE